MKRNSSSFGFFARSRRWPEYAVAIFVWMVALVITAALLWIVGDIVVRGAGGISWTFLTSATRDAGRAGGILPMIVSSLMILAIAMMVAIPAGISVAVLLSEFSRRGGWFGGLIGRTLDVLAAVPSIVFGLFGNAFFCVWLGMGYSILAGGLTLACMVAPILIRTLAAALEQVPDQYRIAATALGIGKTRTTFSVLIPVALPGLFVGIVLGVGRVLAETAALLFTSGYVDRFPRSLLDSGRSLSIHIYDLSMNVAGGERNAFATALVLTGMLSVINFLVIRMSGRWKVRGI